MAIDTDVQKSSVITGSKHSGIISKGLFLTGEVSGLRRAEKSAAAIVPISLINTQAREGPNL